MTTNKPEVIMSDLMSDRELLELAAMAAGYQVDTGFADSPLIYGVDAGIDGPRNYIPAYEPK